MVEVDIYEPLYKFGDNVVALAKKTPEILDILMHLKSQKIEIVSDSVYTTGGAFYINYELSLVAIKLNPNHNPIDILGSLVHEYWHYLQHNIKFSELADSEDNYVISMLRQEIKCFSEQAEFLIKYGPIAQSNRLDLIFSYKRAKLLEYIETRDFKEFGLGYTQYYKYIYANWGNFLKTQDWRANNEESRIQISA